MRRALALLFAVSACGTLDAPAPVHLVDPGKGPFVDTGAVETCQSGARVVSHGSASGGLLGLCVPRDAMPAACGSDKDCGSQETCVCGRCTVEACSGVASCGGNGRLCVMNRCATQCTDDSACASGETCTAGSCARPCTTDDECGFGGSCHSFGGPGTCAARLCSSDMQCKMGERCALQEREADVREPTWAHLASGDQLYVELRAKAGAVRAIFRAHTESTSRFTLDDAPVAGDLAMEGGPGAPSLLVENGAVVALYAERAGTIVALPAGDPTGGSFGDATLVLSPSEDWEGGDVGSPSIVSFQGHNRLFYAANGGTAIGMATLDAMGNVTSRQLVATPGSLEDPLLWHDVATIGSPDAVVAGDLLLLYVAANGIDGGSAFQGSTELPAPRHDAIGLFASADLARFDRAPQGPVYSRKSNLRTYLGAREPAVRLVDGGADMVTVASDAGPPGVAPVGLALAQSR